MNNFDFNSKKYVILLIAVCVMFAILVIKLFDYLPTSVIEQNTFNEEQTQNINLAANKKYEDKFNNDEDDNKHKSGHIDFMPNVNNSEEDDDIDEIDAPPGAVKEDTTKVAQTEGTSLSNEEKAIKCIINANKLKNDSNLSKALSEYQLVADLTSDPELNAMSYEAIAEIYAKNKRYGTALTFASKAYKLSPSMSRELLIARIYYNSGDTENAITRMNNILKKKF